MTKAYQIVTLAGDGIGPEVMAEAVKVIDWFPVTAQLARNARRGPRRRR